MARISTRWLDIVRHRVGRFRAPFLTVVQHHDLPGTTFLVAPLARHRRGEPTALARVVTVEGVVFTLRLLEIAASPRSFLLETVGSAEDEAEDENGAGAGAIMDALDIILHGYPIGRPR